MPDVVVHLKPLRMELLPRENETRRDTCSVCTHTLNNRDQLKVSTSQLVMWPPCAWDEVLDGLHSSTTTSLTTLFIHVINIAAWNLFVIQ